MLRLNLLRFFLLGICLTILPGCESVKNLFSGETSEPLIGAPPPRVRLTNGRYPEADKRGFGDRSGFRHSEDSAIVRVAGGDSTLLAYNDELSDSQKVAMVNGVPILASDILGRYSVQLRHLRAEATAEEYQMVRERLLKQDLENHIQRFLLVDALKKSLPKESLEKLDEYIDVAFAERVNELKKQMNVATRADVEEKLLKDRGMTLHALRVSFANSQMAGQFMRQKTKDTRVIDRLEMVAYYNEHMADYKTPARARWQEIRISHAKHGGKQNAADVMREVLDALRDNPSFDAAVKKYSDGETITENGRWGWTQPGSLRNQQIERALFEIHVHGISDVIAAEDAYHVVKVLERTAVHFKPFGELQQKIKQQLEANDRQENGKKVIADLRRKAVVTTIFDRQQHAASQPMPVSTADSSVPVIPSPSDMVSPVAGDSRGTFREPVQHESSIEALPFPEN